MIRHAIAAALTLAVSSAFAEQKTYNGPQALVAPDSFENVSVRISDDADHGCWMNMHEVKFFAEEKLAAKGFTVVEHDDELRPASPDQAVLNVSVMSTRAKEGGCYGVATVRLLSVVSWKDVLQGSSPIGLSKNRIFTGAHNANLLTLETVDHFVKDWPAGLN